MPSYSTPLDIANRALQHCGATRISSFTEDSKNAASVSFVYDKAREAELRRNTWRFAIKRVALRPVDTDTLLVSFQGWSAVISYRSGQVVSHLGLNWVSNFDDNLNLAPGTSATWDVYYGPSTADQYDTTNTAGYFTGELVYIQSAPGVADVYMSRVDGNSSNPTTVATWDATVTYSKGEIVTYLGTEYRSISDLNLNSQPDTSLIWVVWVGALSSNDWTYQFSTVRSLNIIYPIGSGPASQSVTRNVFVLPNGFLRRAPQDPKAGSVSYLGGPTGLWPDDWNLEGNYLVSAVVTPIILRFVANVTVVSTMDTMFCEGLAARVALEVCEELTQSTSKLSAIMQKYNAAMGSARTVNGIETGPTEPPEDEWITVRM